MSVIQNSGRNRFKIAMLGAMAAVAIGAWLQPAAGADQTFQGPTQAAKAPKDVKLAIVSCSASLKGCQIPSDTAAEVAKGLGWQVAMFDGKANPKTQESAMLDALAWGANVIIAESIDYRSIQLPLKEAKKRNVAVVAVGNGGDSPNPLPKLEPGQVGWTFAVGVDNLALGHAIGDWIVKDSGGKANVVVFNDLEFAGVTRQHTGHGSPSEMRWLRGDGAAVCREPDHHEPRPAGRGFPPRPS
jgi:ABC-type sugar transport system substrate-binding protein